MAETPPFPRMADIDLLKNLEEISFLIANKFLIEQSHVPKENHKTQLEILIFKGFSSSTTHPIEIDLEKKVIEFHYVITNFKLYKAPLKGTEDNFIRANQNAVFFLNQKNWI